LKWLKPKPSIGVTSFQRLKSAWRILCGPSLEVAGKSQVIWARDNQSLVFATGGTKPSSGKIRILDFQLSVGRLLRDLNCTLESMLTQAGIHSSPIQLHMLHDNPLLPASLFVQNSHIFAPLSEAITRCVDALSFRRSRTWLRNEQRCLELIAVLIPLTCGIPPRSFQALDFRFASTLTRLRNLFHLDGCPVLAWPKSKSGNRTHQLTLWMLPEPLAGPIYLYLGVIRPASVPALLKLQRQLTPVYWTHLFVHTNRPTSLWSADHMKTVLQKNTSANFDFPLHLATLRQIMTAIYRQHFPHLMEQPESADLSKTSVANATAGHTDATSIRNYGRTQLANVWCTSDVNIALHFQVSQSWHSMLFA
jgi:hypothetical protein